MYFQPKRRHSRISDPTTPPGDDKMVKDLTDSGESGPLKEEEEDEEEGDKPKKGTS